MNETSGLSGREIIRLCLAALGLAVVMNWPIAAHMGSDIPQDLGDPLLQSWEVAWGGHALVNDPLGFFDSNAFWPLDDSLAFSDALIGYAPTGIIGSGPDAALVRYNALFLFAYALAFAGAYLLARELKAGPAGAAVAGAAFAYAPWRLSQNGHLNVLSSGGIPLALFLLLRGYRTGRPRMVIAGWLVAAWQFSLGFNLGLQFIYLLGVLALVAGVWWLRRDRPALDKPLVRASVIGASVFFVVAVVIAIPYLSVLNDHPEARRTQAEVEFYSPPPEGFLAAPSESIVWGDATASMREKLRWLPEQTLFPGVTVVLLAGLGLAASTYSRALRIGLAIVVLITAILSLGFEFLGGRLTYELLYDLAPGWQGLRTPNRLTTLTTLGLGLLAAAGVSRIAGAAVSRAKWAPFAAFALAGVVLIEGAGDLPHPEVPEPPAALATVTAPRLHLPSDQISDLTYMYWSTDGWPAIANGSSGFIPEETTRMREGVAGFPDAASVALLRDLGVETVVLHLQRAAGTPWAESATRPVEGLGITRSETGDVVVFDLDPS